MDSDVRLDELVVCSLEPWDEVWRRNQFLTDALLRRHPELRVLFVEPPADVLFDLRNRRRPSLPRLRSLAADGRLRAFRPLKPLPRRLGPMADQLLLRQVLWAIRSMGFADPVLWINDVNYAPLIERTGWASVYDVTDDWLLAAFPERELDRFRRLDDLALRSADEVVVCSPSLVETRGTIRDVSLIPNGIDVGHFTRPRARPADLPDGPVAVYAGSLHESRLDVELVVDLAQTLPRLNVALIGPSSLAPASLDRLGALPNVFLLGARPYADIPGYLQHADVIVVPHVVSGFTESLDPIKLYECLAVATPTVATPVAGFREHAGRLDVAERSAFVERVTRVLEAPPQELPPPSLPSWDVRAAAFAEILGRAAAGASSGAGSRPTRPSGPS